MEKMIELATLSVARGSGFAGIAIMTMMIGFAGNVAAMLKAGGILALLAALVLILKAARAPVRHYKSTELWIMLRPEERPRAEIAQQVIGSVLRDTYLRFAQHFAFLGAAMLAGALALSFWLPPSP